MAGYNYMNRGGYTDDDQNRANYGGIECSDHVCRPIIVDAEGRRRPIISYTTPNSHSSETYVTSTERIVEHVRRPVVVTAEYQYRASAAAIIEPLRDYGVTTADKWRRPLSPVLGRPQVMVTDYGGYSSPTKVEPMKDYGAINDKWRRPSSPVRDRPQVVVTDYGNGSPRKLEPMKDNGATIDKWGRPSSPVPDCPQVMVTDYAYGSPTKVEPVKDYGVPKDKWRRPSSPVCDRPQAVVTDYEYGSPTKVEPVKDYGVPKDKWRRPSSPVRDRPQVVVTDYGYGSPRKVEPVKDHGVPNNKWRRPSSSVHDYAYSSPTKVEPVKDYGVPNDKWHRPSSPILDRPQKVEEFITRVQTEASQPTRPGLQSAMQWRNMPNSTGQGGNTGYGGDYTNYNNNGDWNKPSGNTIRDERLAEPILTNRDGWERPGRNGTPLSGPTNDINKAVEILKEAVKSSPVIAAAPAPQPRITVPGSTVPKRDVYVETIDSKEAARRYGNFNLSSRPRQTGENYTGTIDSKEAARKYSGTRVP